jgi:hypothetical protein
MALTKQSMNRPVMGICPGMSDMEMIMKIWENDNGIDNENMGVSNNCEYWSS